LQKGSTATGTAQLTRLPTDSGPLAADAKKNKSAKKAKNRCSNCVC
jgi:hypothetical protein